MRALAFFSGADFRFEDALKQAENVNDKIAKVDDSVRDLRRLLMQSYYTLWMELCLDWPLRAETPMVSRHWAVSATN